MISIFILNLDRLSQFGKFWVELMDVNLFYFQMFKDDIKLQFVKHFFTLKKMFKFIIFFTAVVFTIQFFV